MAQVFHPVHLTDFDGIPVGVGTNNNFSNYDGSYGATSGIVNSDTGDSSARDKVFRVIRQGPRAAFWTDSYTDVDVIARVRIPPTGGKFRIIARASALTLSNSSVQMNSYAVSTEGGTDYRDVEIAKYSGGNASLTTRADFLNTKTLDQQETTYRYVRINCSSGTITAYCWWEGDSVTAQNNSFTLSDAAYTSGVVGFIVSSGMVDIDFISIGTAGDNAATSQTDYILRAEVFQPPVGGDNSVPVSGGAQYPVRSYDRATGSLTGFVYPSTTDATGDITKLATGNQAILTATDLDSNAAEWVKAIAGPVVPTTS